MRLVSLLHARDGEQRRCLRREGAEDDVLDATARTGAGIDVVAYRADNTTLTHLRPCPRLPLHLVADRRRDSQPSPHGHCLVRLRLPAPPSSRRTVPKTLIILLIPF
jgi:hypothetical protein